jgi:hypothetical protein
MADQPAISSADIDGSFRPRAKAHITSAEVDNVAVLYDESYGVCHRLDPVASVIWSLLDGRTTIDELVDQLAELYATDRSTVEVDVMTFVRHLGDLGVLEGVTRGEPGG